VVICAILAAKSVNHLVAGKYLSDSAEPARAELPKATRRAPVVTRSKRGAPVAERNMFCSTCQPEEPGPDGDEAMPDPDSVPLTSLPLELLATNVGRRTEHSFATIRNTSSSSQGAYWHEQEIPGAGPVVRIAGKYVDFRNSASQRVERISLVNDPRNRAAARRTPASTPQRAVAARDPEAGGAEAELDAGIKQLSEDSYEIDRDLVNKLLANPMSVAQGARIVPSVKDGKPNGFKLYAIRPNSVYAKIGLRNGDTIHAINGFELTTPDKALEVYTKVREASNLSVSVIRRGKPTTMNYNIR
jgi:general secretion pathway protein C